MRKLRGLKSVGYKDIPMCSDTLKFIHTSSTTELGSVLLNWSSYRIPFFLPCFWCTTEKKLGSSTWPVILHRKLMLPDEDRINYDRVEHWSPLTFPKGFKIFSLSFSPFQNFRAVLKQLQKVQIPLVQYMVLYWLELFAYHSWSKSQEGFWYIMWCWRSLDRRRTKKGFTIFVISCTKRKTTQNVDTGITISYSDKVHCLPFFFF